MSLTTTLATSPDFVSHSAVALHNSLTLLADTVDIPTQTPPEADKWLRIPGLIKWGAMIIGVTAIIGAAIVMAVEKFSDHGFGNRGAKIAGYAMISGILVTTASGLYAFVSA